MKKLAVIALICLIPLLYLFSPQVADQDQGRYSIYKVKINDKMIFPLNSDSSTFLFLATDFQNIITKENFFQNRPLMILLAKGISLPYLALAKSGLYKILPYPFRMVGEKNILKVLDNVPGSKYYERINEFLNSSNDYYDAYYFGYITINFLLLFLALLLFASFIDKNISAFTIPLLLFLIMNDGVKVLFFSPHTQIFNTLNPVIFVWISYLILNGEKRLTNHPFLFSLAVGLLFLVYGSFSILIPIYFVSLYISGKKLKPTKWLIDLLVSLAIFAAPAVIWISYIKLSGGIYYNWEVTRWHEFVWIIESARLGVLNLFEEVSWKTLLFFDKTLAALSPYSIIFIIFILITSKFHFNFTEFYKINTKKIQAIFVSLSLTIIFFLAMGFYNFRLSLNFVPPILLMIGLAGKDLEKTLPDKTKKKILIYSYIFTFIWIIVQIFKKGPYS